MTTKLINIIRTVWYIPFVVYFNLLNRKRIVFEANHWWEILNLQENPSSFRKCLTLSKILPEFRSLIYFRYHTNPINPIRWIYPPLSTLYIEDNQKIGEGLVIQHGFCTIFNGESIGKNCQVWHGVTIGKAKTGTNQRKPRIGNNVKIHCHAQVLGDIEIGDNVVIGASSVVIKSIPANCVVAGNPAKIIRNNGIKTV